MEAILGAAQRVAASLEPQAVRQLCGLEPHAVRQLRDIFGTFQQLYGGKPDEASE